MTHTHTHNIMENLPWLLGIVGSSLVFFIFQVLIPYKAPQNIDPFVIKRNAAKYDKLEMLAIVIMFTSAIIIGFSVYQLGLFITNCMLSDKYIYIHQAPIAFWGILGFVFGIGLIRIPMILIYTAILKDEYEVYLAYTNIKHGWDGLRVWSVIETLLSSVGILLFILGTSWYVRINTETDEIEFSKLLSITKYTCSVADISEIKHSPKVIQSKDKVIKEVFTINVDTTYAWNSKFLGYFTDIEDDFINLSDGVYKLSEYRELIITKK